MKIRAAATPRPLSKTRFRQLSPAGLYLLHSPEVALLLEVLDSVSSGLFFTVAVMHLSTLVPCESLASFRGMLGTAHLGIGQLASPEA